MDRINELIEASGLTRKEIADRLGISRVALWNKITGTSDFTLTEAAELCEMLGCSINELRRAQS